MKHDGNPPRLRQLGEDLPRELAKGLQDLPGEHATPSQLRDVEVRVRATLGLPVSGAPPAAAGPTGGGLIVPGTLGALAGIAFLVASGVLGPRTATTTISPPTASSVLVGAPLEIKTEPLRAAESNPEEITDRVEPAPLAASSVSPRASAPAAPVDAGRWAAEPEAGSHRADGKDGAWVVGSSAPSDATEVTILGLALQALGNDPGRALELVREHERRFPSGELLQEREVVAIDALIRLRQRPEAEARARRFRAQFPKSAHTRRIDILVESRGAP